MSERQGGGLFDSLLRGFGEAVADIRHKVVEEGWFGRQVTDTTVSAAPADQGGEKAVTRDDLYGRDPRPLLSTRPSFEEQWAAREKPSPAEAPAPVPDRGIDR